MSHSITWAGWVWTSVCGVGGATGQDAASYCDTAALAHPTCTLSPTLPQTIVGPPHTGCPHPTPLPGRPTEAATTVGAPTQAATTAAAHLVHLLDARVDVGRLHTTDCSVAKIHISGHAGGWLGRFDRGSNQSTQAGATLPRTSADLRPKARTRWPRGCCSTVKAPLYKQTSSQSENIQNWHAPG